MAIDNPRIYGPPPYRIAVIHGGPGAGGEMAPVARELASVGGVLEPLQTAVSLEGQVQELQSIVTDHGRSPVTLIGYSWGAWLAFIVAARYPKCCPTFASSCWSGAVTSRGSNATLATRSTVRSGRV